MFTIRDFTIEPRRLESREFDLTPMEQEAVSYARANGRLVRVTVMVFPSRSQIFHVEAAE